MLSDEDREHLSRHYTLGCAAYEKARRAVYDAASALRYGQETFQARLDGRNAKDVLAEAKAVLAATPMGHWKDDLPR